MIGQTKSYLDGNEGDNDFFQLGGVLCLRFGLNLQREQKAGKREKEREREREREREKEEKRRENENERDSHQSKDNTFRPSWISLMKESC